MDMTSTLTRIKLKLGLNAIVTPFPDLNNVIKTIITDITVPVFSLYVPDKVSLMIDTRELKILRDGQNMVEYQLPNWKRKLIEVNDVRYSESTMAGLGFYTGQFPLFESGVMGAFMLSNTTAQLMQQMIPKMTFQYIPKGRKLRIWNAYYNSQMYIDCSFEHDKSLVSIPDSARESFMRLALLDVKENIYPTLKMFNNVDTAFGKIDLKLENWENAENERLELLEKWDDTYHLDHQPIYYI